MSRLKSRVNISQSLGVTREGSQYTVTVSQLLWDWERILYCIVCTAVLYINVGTYLHFLLRDDDNLKSTVCRGLHCTTKPAELNSISHVIKVYLLNLAKVVCIEGILHHTVSICVPIYSIFKLKLKQHSCIVLTFKCAYFQQIVISLKSGSNGPI